MATARVSLRLAIVAVIGLFTVAGIVSAHEHHTEDIPEGEVVSAEPLDTILWLHISIQILSWGIIFPTGMVLGIVRSRWHIPVQVLGTAFAILGYFLGHAHGGRQFSPNIHSKFANILMVMLISQIVIGVYLRIHLKKGVHARLRTSVVTLHGIIGKLLPVVSWVQMLFGGITALGFCRDDHLGQCLAHFIMGSAFIGYGIILTIMMLVGQLWLKRTGRSQEFFDSSFITLWGIINTFTEHHWGGPWVHNDLQHTSMGIVWWCAGLVGMWLSRNRDGGPKRNLFPGIVIFLTGWAMSGHPQSLPLSTMVHRVFGYSLMLAGLTRMIEIAFVLRDRPHLSQDGSDINSFQNIPPFLLIASGFCFMGATEEQMKLISGAHVTHVTYILILYSFAFLVFLLVNVLLHLYAVHIPSVDSPGPKISVTGSNGHLRTPSTQVRDAEEFELEGLMSDEEEESVDLPGHQPAKRSQRVA